VGYDLVEYHPHLWHPTKDRTIVHIDSSPAEVDAHYPVCVGVVGDIRHSLDRIAQQVKPFKAHALRPLREALIKEMNQHRDDTSYPVKPQKLIWDLRTALNLEDIVICDVGAHKMWMARMFRCEYPNTCLISNGFASMGIAVPGAIGAKMACPDKAVVAVTGDGGFMMNIQEIETCVRLKIPMVVLIWNDSGYGLIEWKQLSQFGRSSHVDFDNPDFIKLAESFGAKGYKIEDTSELLPTLKSAISDDAVSIIDCPVDYSENMRLTEKLGEMIIHL
jgi:acetolactate synthase-1/2/3 large subunit